MIIPHKASKTEALSFMPSSWSYFGSDFYTPNNSECRYAVSIGRGVGARLLWTMSHLAHRNKWCVYLLLLMPGFQPVSVCVCVVGVITNPKESFIGTKMSFLRASCHKNTQQCNEGVAVFRLNMGGFMPVPHLHVPWRCTWAVSGDCIGGPDLWALVWVKSMLAT